MIYNGGDNIVIFSSKNSKVELEGYLDGTYSDFKRALDELADALESSNLNPLKDGYYIMELSREEIYRLVRVLADKSNVIDSDSIMYIRSLEGLYVMRQLN